MFTPFVTDEHPVVLYGGVGLHPTIFTLGKTSLLVLLSLNQMAPPQYTSEGLAIIEGLWSKVARKQQNGEKEDEKRESVRFPFH